MGKVATIQLDQYAYRPLNQADFLLSDGQFETCKTLNIGSWKEIFVAPDLRVVGCAKSQ